MTASNGKKDAKKWRRLSHKNRVHVEQVAQIYVACSEDSKETAKLVCERIPALIPFSHRALAAWRRTKDWHRALKDAHNNAAVQKELSDSGRAKIVFDAGLATMRYLSEQLMKAIASEDTDLVFKLQARICTLNKRMTLEETELGANRPQGKTPFNACGGVYQQMFGDRAKDGS